jgi:toxin ParE1/3/4
MKVIFSTKAEEDLAGMFQYISDVLLNTNAAYNIVDKILDLSQKLSRFPELGANLKTIDATLDNHRYLIADNYLIVYKVVDQEVFILRVIYARSDYARLLQG